MREALAPSRNAKLKRKKTKKRSVRGNLVLVPEPQLKVWGDTGLLSEQQQSTVCTPPGQLLLSAQKHKTALGKDLNRKLNTSNARELIYD
jgi:hypothetical protein